MSVITEIASSPANGATENMRKAYTLAYTALLTEGIPQKLAQRFAFIKVADGLMARGLSADETQTVMANTLIDFR